MEGNTIKRRWEVVRCYVCGHNKVGAVVLKNVPGSVSGKGPDRPETSVRL
jgi:hypothetical protein